MVNRRETPKKNNNINNSILRQFVWSVSKADSSSLVNKQIAYLNCVKNSHSFTLSKEDTCGGGSGKSSSGKSLNRYSCSLNGLIEPSDSSSSALGTSLLIALNRSTSFPYEQKNYSREKFRDEWNSIRCQAYIGKARNPRNCLLEFVAIEIHIPLIIGLPINGK